MAYAPCLVSLCEMSAVMEQLRGALLPPPFHSAHVRQLYTHAPCVRITRLSLSKDSTTTFTIVTQGVLALCLALYIKDNNSPHITCTRAIHLKLIFENVESLNHVDTRRSSCPPRWRHQCALVGPVSRGQYMLVIDMCRPCMSSDISNPYGST
jgi:hypothetical protein